MQYGQYVGERIAKLREEKGWNRADLGAAAGGWDISVCRIENGDKQSNSDMRTVSLSRVAAALEVSLDQLLLIDGTHPIHVLPELYEVAIESRWTVATVGALASFQFKRYPQTRAEWVSLYDAVKQYLVDIGRGQIIYISGMDKFVQGYLLIDARDTPSPPSVSFTSAYFAMSSLSSPDLSTTDARQALMKIKELAEYNNVYIITSSWVQRCRIKTALERGEGDPPLFHIINYGQEYLDRDRCQRIFQIFKDVKDDGLYEFGYQVQIQYDKEVRNALNLYRLTLNQALVDSPHLVAFVLVLGDMSAELTANVARVFKEKTGEYPLVVVGDQLVPINEVGGAV